MSLLSRVGRSYENARQPPYKPVEPVQLARLPPIRLFGSNSLTSSGPVRSPSSLAASSVQFRPNLSQYELLVGRLGGGSTLLFWSGRV